MIGQRGATSTRGTAVGSRAAQAARALEAVWVRTGSAVSSEYDVLRSEASDQARARNMCYENATKAFLRCVMRAVVRAVVLACSLAAWR